MSAWDSITAENFFKKKEVFLPQCAPGENAQRTQSPICATVWSPFGSDGTEACQTLRFSAAGEAPVRSKRYPSADAAAGHFHQMIV